MEGDPANKMSVSKPLEFAQRLTLLGFIFSGVIVVAVLAANFILLWADKQPMTQETVTAITIYGGVTSGISITAYGTLTAVRSWSQNKHVKGKKEEE